MTTNWTRDDVTFTMTTSSGLEGGGGPSWGSVLILCVFVFIIVGTVIGNSLVCAAVAIVRCLRTPSNLLIVSLAVSDLLVASLVMGLAAFYEVEVYTTKSACTSPGFLPAYYELLTVQQLVNAKLNLIVYHLRMRRGNALSHVCLSVCLSVLFWL